MEKKKLNLKKVKIAKLSTSSLTSEALKNVKGGDCFYSVVETDTITPTPTTMAPSITSCCVTGGSANEETCNTRQS
ncbi:MULTISPECIES: hypothetical protein [Chryseobacterium]|uniref:Uncharacterized protein n=1 Tax=Candidatus Chryseobacterium massiliense TaxID=204089 RepID=A0A3D9BE65_9FLAO|nr:MULTISPECIES: hypothetical protein [Chryseobacterium]REC51686.1 hypothetical protein DRF68_05215 [Candidatus Chryseobacterium massiliae]